MIAFWNRKEVFAGFDLGHLARVRDTLAAAGIRYFYKAVWHGGGRARNLIGSYGENPSFSSMYYVYVHKDDFDLAQHELNKPRRD